MGGDSAYSTALPNGEEAFDFSDTLVGTSQPDGAASLTGMPHNSELVGTMPNLESDYGGTYRAPTALMPDSGDASWQVGATYVENGEQLVFANEFVPTTGSVYDTYTGTSAIIALSLATDEPTYRSATLIPTDPDTQWGKAVVQTGGYDYIYGSDVDVAADAFYGMKTARVPVGESLQMADWTYWNGSNLGLGREQRCPRPDLYRGDWRRWLVE